jgi:hypothetical protein
MRAGSVRRSLLPYYYLFLVPKQLHLLNSHTAIPQQRILSNIDKNFGKFGARNRLWKSCFVAHAPFETNASRASLAANPSSQLILMKYFCVSAEASW